MNNENSEKKNSERLISSIGKIDDKYISEYAEVKPASAAPKLRLKRIIPIAACLIILLCAVPFIGRFMTGKTPAVPAPTEVTDTTANSAVTEEPEVTAKPETGTSSEFTVENGVLLAYTGNSAQVEIPDEVTFVSSSAFKNNSAAGSIKKLTANKATFEKGSLSALTGLECIEILDSSPENLEDVLSTLFSYTVEELISQGIGLKYEYCENGGTPIYSVTNTDGVMLSFGDTGANNPLTGNENPKKIIISKDTVSTAKGLRAKMTVDDAKALNVEWDDIYFNCDSLFYYTVIFDGGNKYTYAWEMTEEQYNNWLRTIGINDTFINAPEKYAQPYLSGELGVINKITIESAALPAVES